ncbi:MAG: endo-1,4-beta-xylanase [Pirellulales bacterium]
MTIQSFIQSALVRAASVVGVLTALWMPARAAEMPGSELQAGADARIEKYRKADASVSVVDASGKPIPGAKVTVEQTRHAFLFGCNIFLWGRVGSEADENAYRQRFAALLNYATLPFYWPTYEPRRGEPDHERTERIARWCKDEGIAVKGHPLAWNFADPRWLPDDLDEIRKLQMARIDDCVGRFKGLIDRFDVVNEATHYDREEFKRNAPKMTAAWAKAGQIEFTRECFLRARQANPAATLLINDYRTDPAYVALIEKLVDDKGKRLYDVIGIQSHMHGGVWSNRQVWDVCERFAKFGVPLHFTETTILSSLGGRKPGEALASTPEGEAFQAREVERFYTMLFSHPAVEGLTWWDFSDRRAWQAAPAGLVRDDMSPKPAYERLIALVKGKWWTKTAAQSDSGGVASFRGFLGDYRITVEVPTKTTVVKEFTLGKGAANKLTVVVP